MLRAVWLIFSITFLMFGMGCFGQTTDPRLKPFLEEQAYTLSLLAHPTAAFINAKANSKGYIVIHYRDRFDQTQNELKFRAKLDSKKRLTRLLPLKDDGGYKPFTAMENVKIAAKTAIKVYGHMNNSYIKVLVTKLGSDQIDKLKPIELARIILSVRWEAYKNEHPLGTLGKHKPTPVVTDDPSTPEPIEGSPTPTPFETIESTPIPVAVSTTPPETLVVPKPPVEEAMASPELILKSYYRACNNHDAKGAYAHFSQRYQDHTHNFDEYYKKIFVHFDRIEVIEMQEMGRYESNAQVYVQLKVYPRIKPNSPEVWKGEAYVVKENNLWKLDDMSLKKKIN